MALGRLLILAAALAVCSAGAALAQAPDSGAMTGEAMFKENCSACHQVTGKGIPGAFPALAGDPFVVGPPERVAATVVHGRGGMPTFGPELTDVQIATILTYVRSAWGNQASAITPAMVAKVRTSAAMDKPHVPEMVH
jgi:mono/diheme cytochrome c family protein